MRTFVIAAALLALALPAVATAKGPVSAFISGPGLQRGLEISGDGETVGTPLGNLANSSGFFAQMFGQSPDPTLATRPSGKLGLRYKVVYVLPGPSGPRVESSSSCTRTRKPRALTYMKPGQAFFDTEQTRGGWYRASPTLKRMLVRAGLSAKAPA